MKKIMLICPPGTMTGKLKNRYRFIASDSIPDSMRCCNDLGFIASVLQKSSHKVFLRDYRAEKLTALDYLDDILCNDPDVVLMVVNPQTLIDDLKTVRMIKSSNPEVVMILKSDLFFNPSNELLSNIDFTGVDYLIGAEAAFVMPLLVDIHFNSPQDVVKIPYILFKKDGYMQRTTFDAPRGDITSLPLPDRNLIKNELYYRPDTDQVVAAIVTSRGSESKNIYSPEALIGGNILRVRTPQNVFEEMLDCFTKHGIRNFFFPNDTFAHKEEWVLDLCDLILSSQMHNQIEWFVNINVSNFTDNVALAVKEAGCSVVGLRFDSGSDDTLLKLKTGVTVDENINAAEIAEKNNLKIYGFFSVGFPWEDDTHLEATKNLMLKVHADFVSLTFPVPYPGTELEKIMRDEHILTECIITKECGLRIPPMGTKFLSHKHLRKFRRKVLTLCYFNPKFLIKKIKEIVKKPSLFCDYFNFMINRFKDKRADK